MLQEKRKKNRFIIHSRESNHTGHWYISKKEQAVSDAKSDSDKGKDSLNERKMTHTESRSNLETVFDHII